MPKFVNMTDDEIQAFKEKYGRAPTMREQLYNDGIDRGPRKFPYKPVPRDKNLETVFDAALAEAEKKLAEERARKETPGERAVRQIRELKEQELAKRAAEEAYNAHLGSVKPTLDKLQAIRDRLVWLPEVEVQEIWMVEDAIEQLGHPGNCQLTGCEMAAKVFERERERQQTRKQEVVDRMTALGEQKAEIEAAVKSLETE